MMNRPFFRPPNRDKAAQTGAPTGKGDALGAQGAAQDSTLSVDIDQLRRRILDAILSGGMVLGVLALAASIPERVREGDIALAIILLGAFGFLLIIGFGKKLPYRFRALGLLILVALVGMATLVGDGLYGNGRLYLIILPVIAGMLLGGRPGLIVFGLTIAALIVVGISMLTGGLALPEVSTQASPGGVNGSVSYWLLAITTYILVGGAVSLSLYALLGGLTENLNHARRLALQLDTERSQLEHRVVTRTQDLERRLVQIRTAAEISRSITVSFLGRNLNLPAATGAAAERTTGAPTGRVQPAEKVDAQQELIQLVVDLVRERFDLYYVGVFLQDARSQQAVLRAGTGLAGERMLADKHALQVDDNSMIGWCIRHRQPRIALDVASASTPLNPADRHKRTEVTITRFNNPLLPHTRSELALPMLSGESVLGAMTVQSEHARAFDQDDITVLQGIADTLTAALENIRLFQQAEQNLSEIRSLNRQYLVEAWNTASRLPEFRDYEYVGTVDTSGSVQPAPSSAAAEQDGQGATIRIESPLVLREQAIGSLAVERVTPLTPEEHALLDAVATEAALALENVRLLEQTQRKAGQERLVSHIARQVRGSTDIDTILSITVRELGQALGASSALIHLGASQAQTQAQTPEMKNESE